MTIASIQWRLFYAKHRTLRLLSALLWPLQEKGPEKGPGEREALSPPGSRGRTRAGPGLSPEISTAVGPRVSVFVPAAGAGSPTGAFCSVEAARSQEPARAKLRGCLRARDPRRGARGQATGGQPALQPVWAAVPGEGATSRGRRSRSAAGLPRRSGRERGPRRGGEAPGGTGRTHSSRS